MDCEKRFKRLVVDLVDLIFKHMAEWDEAKQGIFDIDEIMKRVEEEKDKPAEIVYFD